MKDLVVCLVTDFIICSSPLVQISKTYESREYGVMDQELTYSASEIGARMGEDPYFICDINTATYPNGIIESCTNPSTIHNGALYFITCYPLDAYKTDGRLVIKFRSLSGPNLLLGEQ